MFAIKFVGEDDNSVIPYVANIPFHPFVMDSLRAETWCTRVNLLELVFRYLSLDIFSPKIDILRTC